MSLAVMQTLNAYAASTAELDRPSPMRLPHDRPGGRLATLLIDLIAHEFIIVDVLGILPVVVRLTQCTVAAC